MVATALLGCSNQPAEAPPASSERSTGGTDEGAVGPVGRVASANPGSVNTYWLHGPEGLIVIDSGRSVAGGRAAVAETQATGQPVIAIVITHPHPDHVGGLGELRDAYPQAPIYASEATAEWMRSDPLGFYVLAAEADPDFPAELTFPDRTFSPGEVLDVGGLTLESAQFEPGESENATAYYEPTTGALFSGDLTANQATPALLEGNTCGWLTNLDALTSRFPDAGMIYPGHGEPAEATTEITEQRTYLQDFRALVRATVDPSSPEGPAVTAEERASVIAETERRYPGYPSVASIPNLSEVNVDAVAAELLAEPADLPTACRP